jgi:glutamate-5-semialdehyde dehydrogenase
MSERLERLREGQEIPYGGNRVAFVSAELADAFEAGDSLIVVQETGDLLHVRAGEREIATAAVNRAVAAFGRMGSVSDEQVSEFYERFAALLEDDAAFAPIAEANVRDVQSAKERGRSTTRLVLSDRMRRGMVAGLRGWRDTPTLRGQVTEVVTHDRWRVELVRDGLGVVGFVFEGRPNVFADATGVLRAGNTVVFRIGSDALGTARAIVEHALTPALRDSGLPEGAASLIASASRATAWVMMSDPRLSLAVARGSGGAVAQLGAVARQAGNAVSLHGTGGSWLVASETADADAFRQSVYHSLDRKVCNTLNTCCIPASRADDLVPEFLTAIEKAGARLGTNSKLHVLDTRRDVVPSDWYERRLPIARAEGDVLEPQAEVIAEADLGVEWEWEDSPEVTLAIVDSVEQAVGWFNRYSPRFGASLVSEDPEEHEAFFDAVDAPFVGNGFTRWVDGQYALDRPELGLSNWENGRLFGRGGVLSGDSVFTIRTRAVQDDADIGR